MKKKITLSLWLSVFFGGIWQFLCNVFSWKNKTPFWRVIWACITACVVLFTCMLAYAFYTEFFGRRYYQSQYCPVVEMSDAFEYVDKGRNSGKSYVVNRNNGRKVFEDIDWMAFSEDGDSLAVFARNGKRGFFDKVRGEVAIAADYDAAWCFNDGVAAVCKGDSVFFIDHSGNPVNGCRYLRKEGRSYAYHGDLFAFDRNGLYGLVDRTGLEVLPAEYESLTPMAHRMWVMRAGGQSGVAGADGNIVLPCEYRDVSVYPDDGIVVTLDDYSMKRYGYAGDLIDDFVVGSVETLEYVSDEFDDNGERRMAPATLHRYYADGRYGLISRQGKPLTPPLYTAICAVGRDVYECQLTDENVNILLDSEGNKINN